MRYFVLHVIFIAFLQGSRDNMSIVIIAFEGAPKVSETALQNEKELDKRLEKRIRGISSLSLSVCFTVYVCILN